MLYRLADYIPILTSLLALIFMFQILKIYLRFKNKYFLWWTFGLLIVCCGTMAESFNTLFGWSAANFRFWFIVGALFGGFPLAQGTVYLLMSEKIGDRTTIFGLIYILIASTCFLLSPIVIPEDFNGKLSGDVIAWQWTRFMSIPINIYSFIFLFGGAVYSANQYFGQINRESRFIASIYISFGAILPGIGGIYMKIGYVNVLYITEFVALLLIYRGFQIFIKDAESEEEE